MTTSYKFNWKKFNYWDSEHYVTTIVTGSKEECMSMFKKESKKYPYMQYATIIIEKNMKPGESDSSITIRRFKTKELLRIHHDFPLTYIREGRIL